MDKGINAILFGLAALGPGLYLIVHDLPETSSYLAQITLSGLPTLLGGILAGFGVVGVVTAAAGMRRRGDEAIDLKVSADGLTVRGGRTIPWDAVSRVVAVHYRNAANIRPLWERADLNRAVVLQLERPVDLPRVTTGRGEPCLTVRLNPYPAIEYRDLYDSMVADFERRGIPVELEHRSKPT
ncbi:hypothetical protein AAG589_01065 [Isoptericola sp. F-RaC21]|uniref:hypothetical protein n=1 Tax=Isoptericola sp. F-RaC21 TaxID=3141452 RepID=UPI00315C2E54